MNNNRRRPPQTPPNARRRNPNNPQRRQGQGSQVQAVRRRKRIRKKRTNYFPLIIFIAIIITLLFIILQCNSKEEPSDDIVNERIVNMSAPETEAVIVQSVSEMDDQDILSYSSVLYNITKDTIICGRNMDEVTYPASLTKIMTAIVAIESIDPEEYFETYVTLEEDMFEYIASENASVAGFQSGERVRIIDLFYGVMLPSGAEACIGLARYIAGSESGFADLMNAKAEALGCTDTYFVNSTGLHDINHRTTAKDMLIILKYALKNVLFRTIFTTDTYTTGATNMRDSVTFTSTVFRAFTNNGYEVGNVIGGKTGYTIEAKLCLATLAKTPEAEYILITMGAGDGTNQTAYHVMDTVKIYERYAH